MLIAKTINLGSSVLSLTGAVHAQAYEWTTLLELIAVLLIRVQNMLGSTIGMGQLLHYIQLDLKTIANHSPVT